MDSCAAAGKAGRFRRHRDLPYEQDVILSHRGRHPNRWRIQRVLANESLCSSPIPRCISWKTALTAGKATGVVSRTRCPEPVGTASRVRRLQGGLKAQSQRTHGRYSNRKLLRPQSRQAFDETLLLSRNPILNSTLGSQRHPNATIPPKRGPDRAWVDVVDSRLDHRICDFHELLSEILASEQAEQRLRSMLQANRYILLVHETAITLPAS
jgi:hypothetical protein